MSEKRKERWKDEEYRKKISEANKGKNNPQAKYNLWDISSVHYRKYNMFRGGREPNPCKCFVFKYNGYRLPISYFHDFVTPQIINDLISDALDEES